MKSLIIAHGKRFDRVPVDLHHSSYVKADHSQYSSPVEAMNLTVESKSLPNEANISTDP